MIIEKLQNKRTPTPVTWSGVWSASQIASGSPRKLLYIARNIQGAKSWSPVLEEGQLHEDDIIARLRANGYNITDRNKEFTSSEWPVIGHPDGIIQVFISFYPLEAKSVNWHWFNELVTKGCKEQFPEYYNQIQIYLWLTQLDTALLIAKCRDTGQLYEEFINYDWPTVETLLHDVVGVALNAYQQELDYSSIPCRCSERMQKYCEYRYFCEHGANVEVLVNLTDDSALQALELYKEAKVLADRAEEMKESSKKVLSALLTSNNTNKFSVDGSVIQRVFGSRESADISALKKALGADAYQYIKSTKFDYIRVD